MKRVVKALPQVLVADDIENNDIIGVDYDGHRCVVLPVGDLGYMGFALDESSTFGKWCKRTKSEYVTEALKQSDTEVFIFDNRYELMRWMLKDRAFTAGVSEAN